MELNDFKKPYNIVTTVLTLLGIGVGIYFYYKGKQFKEISYQIDPKASIIYDKKNTSSLIALTDRNSMPITENVYYVRGKIWNSGNLPIFTNDIRIPLSIKLNSCKRILDFKIEQEYEDTTQGFKLSKCDSTKLNLSWKFFDPNNGFSFQIIYIGNEIPNSKLIGKIQGISDFKQIGTEKKEPIWVTIASTILAFLFGFSADNIIPSIFGKSSKVKPGMRLLLLIIFVAIFSFLCNFLISSLFQSSIPF